MTCQLIFESTKSCYEIFARAIIIELNVNDRSTADNRKY